MTSLVEPDVIDDLDLDTPVPCQARSINPERPRVCDQPAEWVAVFNCNHSATVCNKHLGHLTVALSSFLICCVLHDPHFRAVKIVRREKL